MSASGFEGLEARRSEWQIDCERRAIIALELVGARACNRSMGEISSDELYVTAEIDGLGFSYWIYDDCANVSGPRVDYRYEVGAYRDSDELRDQFLVGLLETVLMARHRDWGRLPKNWRPWWRRWIPR